MCPGRVALTERRDLSTLVVDRAGLAVGVSLDMAVSFDRAEVMVSLEGWLSDEDAGSWIAPV